MQLLGYQASHGMRFEWPGARTHGTDPEAILTVILGHGRGAVLHGDSMPPCILIPLRGSLQISLAECALALRAREYLILEDCQPVQLRARAGAMWVAVLAPRGVWQQLLRGVTAPLMAEPMLMPAQGATARELLRAVVALARESTRSAGAPGDRADAIADFAQALAEQQTTFDPLIARCPGRTLGQRRGVFVRLQRVQRFMRANSHLDLDTAALARRANYSLSHFIRAYHRVFGQTPHAALVGNRLQRAHALLGSSELAVSEVALASGFENRCAFSRVFKRHFGVTALEVRRGIAA